MRAAFEAKLYSLGGQPDTNLTRVYDPTRDSWRERKRMPTARGGGAAAVLDDKIFVVGGRPPAANAFEAYDIGDDAWTVLPQLPTRFDNRLPPGGGSPAAGSTGRPSAATTDA